MVAKRFPQLRFGVLADHLYTGRSVLHAVLREVDNVSIITRGRSDAALYELIGRILGKQCRKNATMGVPSPAGRRSG